jgi:hypothetical protein
VLPLLRIDAPPPVSAVRIANGPRLRSKLERPIYNWAILDIVPLSTNHKYSNWFAGSGEFHIIKFRYDNGTDIPY